MWQQVREQKTTKCKSGEATEFAELVGMRMGRGASNRYSKRDGGWSNWVSGERMNDAGR